MTRHWGGFERFGLVMALAIVAVVQLLVVVEVFGDLPPADFDAFRLAYGFLGLTLLYLSAAAFGELLARFREHGLTPRGVRAYYALAAIGVGVAPALSYGGYVRPELWRLELLVAIAYASLFVIRAIPDRWFASIARRIGAAEAGDRS